jgi:hypothetical protein
VKNLASRNANERFAEISAGQHTYESIGGLLEAIDDVFAIGNITGTNFRANIVAGSRSCSALAVAL